MYLEGAYPVHTSIELRPVAGRSGTFMLNIVARFVGREPTARLAIALSKPSHVFWNARFSPEHHDKLSSLVFRGAFEIELELIAAMEQMGLPLDGLGEVPKAK